MLISMRVAPALLQPRSFLSREIAGGHWNRTFTGQTLDEETWLQH